MDEFFGRYTLPKLSQGKIENLNGSVLYLLKKLNSYLKPF